MDEFEKEFEGDEQIADLVTLLSLDYVPADPWNGFWEQYFADVPPRPDVGPWGDPL